MGIRIVLLFVLVALTAIGQSVSTELEALNRGAGSQAKLSTIEVKRRAALLYQLIGQDPRRAIELALFETVTETEGILEATVEDDFAHRRSKTQWALRTPDSVVDLFFGNRSPTAAGCGRILRVSGIRAGTRIAVSAFTDAGRELPELSSSQCSAFSSGTRNVAVLMLRTPNSALPAAVTSTTLNSAFFGPGQSLKSYWSEVSYGRVTAAGSVFGPFTLDANYTCDQLEPILSAAIRAADASVDFTQYHHIVMILPNNSSCSIGTASLGCRSLSSPSKGNFSSGVSWLRADYLSRNDASVSMAAHELGHNLGLDHANTMTYPTFALEDPAAATFDEYGDYFSAMGLSFTFNGGTLIGHYGAPHKSRLGWFSAANVTSVTASGTYTIAPLESSTTGPQALRIRRSNNADLWIEFRRNAGFNATTASVIGDFNGAWIRYQSPALAFDESYTNLLNFHPGTDVENSLLRVGETWPDPLTTLRLRVDTATNAGLTITVTDPPAIDIPALSTLSTSPNPALSFQSFSLTVNGSGFNPATAQVIVGSTTIADTSLTSKTATQLQLNLTRVAGTYNVSVRNGSTGIASNALVLTVSAPASTPTIATLTPNQVASGANTFTISGTNFNTTTAQVEVNGTAIAPLSRTATQLVFATLLAPGSYGVIVRNGTGGAASNAVTLTANAPSISAVTPNPTTAGSNSFILTGTNFNATTAQVEVGNNVIAPVSRTATQLVFATTLLAGSYSVLARNGAGGAASNAVTLTVTSAVSSGSYFVPITPCRAVDTRPNSIMARDSSRNFTFGNCSIPSNATALALNVTLVPSGQFGFLSIWPAGQSQPVVSTMNSLDGRIKANAAIVGVSAGGAVSVYVTDSAHILLDVNGYFVPAGTAGALAYYPLNPCRIVDTRNTGGIVGAQTTRRISGGCLPSSAQAYSLNITSVPPAPLGFLTLWPEGSAQPTVSTLNNLTGTVVANAAILRSGSGGAFNAFVTDASHLVADLNGYFAPPGSPGALAFYPSTPCRIFDTRNADGSFGGPAMAANATRSFTVPSSACGIPTTAQAYVTNATVLPSGIFGFLTMWQGGQTQPTVSTLNAVDGALTSNAAVVPTSSSGVIQIYTSNATHMLLDISGFFAP